jgi:hypothetical protein
MMVAEASAAAQAIMSAGNHPGCFIRCDDDDDRNNCNVHNMKSMIQALPTVEGRETDTDGTSSTNSYLITLRQPQQSFDEIAADDSVSVSMFEGLKIDPDAVDKTPLTLLSFHGNDGTSKTIMADDAGEIVLTLAERKKAEKNARRRERRERRAAKRRKKNNKSGAPKKKAKSSASSSVVSSSKHAKDQKKEERQQRKAERTQKLNVRKQRRKDMQQLRQSVSSMKVS